MKKFVLIVGLMGFYQANVVGSSPSWWWPFGKTTQSSVAPDPLISAASKGDLISVAEKIKTGANINAKDPNGLTALHHAVNVGNAEMVNFLLKNNAKVDIKDNSNQTPLAAANEKIIEIRAHDSMNGVGNFLDIITSLLGNDASFDQTDDCGWLAYEAAKAGNEKLLLTAFSSAVSMREGTSPESMAQHNRYLGITDVSGKTMLHWAVENGNARIVQIILANVLSNQTAYIGLQDKLGNTALHYAFNNEPLLKKLIERTGDDRVSVTAVNVQNAQGRTVLHKAAGMIFLGEGIVRLLLQNGADKTIKDNDGQKPIDLAKNSSIREMLAKNSNIVSKLGNNFLGAVLK